MVPSPRVPDAEPAPPVPPDTAWVGDASAQGKTNQTFPMESYGLREVCPNHHASHRARPESQCSRGIKEERATHRPKASQHGDYSTFPGMSFPHFRRLEPSAAGSWGSHLSDLLSHPMRLFTMLSSKAPLCEIALRKRAGSRCQRTREGGGEAGTEHSGFTLDESGRVGGALPPSPSIASPALPSFRLAD